MFPGKFPETVECDVSPTLWTSRGMDGKTLLMLHRHLSFPIGRECELAGWRAETLKSEEEWWVRMWDLYITDSVIVTFLKAFSCMVCVSQDKHYLDTFSRFTKINCSWYSLHNCQACRFEILFFHTFQDKSNVGGAILSQLMCRSHRGVNSK